jgi:hypothetical protein
MRKGGYNGCTVCGVSRCRPPWQEAHVLQASGAPCSRQKRSTGAVRARTTTGRQKKPVTRGTGSAGADDPGEAIACGRAWESASPGRAAPRHARARGLQVVLRSGTRRPTAPESSCSHLVPPFRLRQNSEHRDGLQKPRPSRHYFRRALDQLGFRKG